ncbi:hypothetical protein SDD30_10380 [Moorella naiadis]|uniref:hypothetical protein n=1 Tax=Moorella naiadis (nom. illeg.) TaxID=3093670 RepID=UPI003D9C7FF7
MGLFNLAWLTFLSGNLLAILTAFCLTRGRGLAPAEGFLAIFVLAGAQITGTMLLAGTILRLTVGWLLGLNAVLLMAACIWTSLAPAPGLNAWPRPDADWSNNFWTKLLLFLAVLETAWLIFLGYLLPPYAWDSLYYHLTAAATWLQAGRIVLSPYTLWANVYPMNTELLFAWNLLLTGSDLLVDLTQLPFALAGGLAVYALGRQAGLKQAGSAVAGALFFLTPIVLIQSKTCYVDVAFAAMFLVGYYFAWRYYHSPRRGYLLLTALAAGLVTGMKASAAPYVAVIFAIVLAGDWRAGQEDGQPAWCRMLISAAIFAMAILLWGGFWYLRNWLAYGNPLYPFTIRILGHTLWPGEGSVAGLVMAGNTPPELVGLPTWQQLLRSWQEVVAPYTFDQRLGGFGPQWLYLELPALALVLLLSLVHGGRKLLLFFQGRGYLAPLYRDVKEPPAVDQDAWELPSLPGNAQGLQPVSRGPGRELCQDRDPCRQTAPAKDTNGKGRYLQDSCRLVPLLLPLILLFWLQPAPWWTRYTIFIVAAGALSLAYLEEHLPCFWARPLRVATLSLVLVSLAGSLTHGYFTPGVIARFLALPSERRTFFQLTPWGDELAWVDGIPSGSRIAYTETSFPYLLFGPRLQNQVVRIIAPTEKEMLRQLRDNGSRFFLTRTTSSYYRWAQNNPQLLEPFFSFGDYVTYRMKATLKM